ncbi:hypothetical protein BCR39DRAFT_556705 [Naematelia encephala]|uniref:non-specific serine/threonine protein kinase n=1 Tax=Naematelia encephala TaxID=71784 RepID=A0A1Y2BJL3_9TREE|nr:hypothetical protein BCR39DRAFT_556705 [Naematelia encephala]
MGNISSMARASTALDSYVAELGDISYDKSLSSSRFLKTILVRHSYGPLVLKIFIKPDPTMSLRVIQRRLKTEREALEDLASCMSYMSFVETEKAGYLVRQWAGSNLYDRVSMQPYLAEVEKKWIGFQLLTCLRDARTRKISHGDIKSENVLITSDLHLLLTDFSSSFKPTFLPLDDPSDFSFFYDTSARRTCYIAPERFFSSDSKLAEERRALASGGDAWSKRNGRVTEEMDVFSAGCVLAEMWSDGRTVFSLSEMFAYREGSVGLEGILDNIEDENVKTMISQMLSREPGDRPSFDRLLTDFRGSIFPEYFYTFLSEYTSSLSELPEGPDGPFLQKVASLPGTKIDRMLEEWDSISIHLEQKGREVDSNGPALLLLNIVTASVRNCIWPSSRLHGLHLFLKLLPYLMDEDKVDRIIPFVVELLSDDVAIVRAEACRVLVLVVESVRSITPLNATFIPEYLLPQLRHLATDADVFVRATYARGLVRLADAAINMLEMSQAAKVDKSELEASGVIEPDYDAMLHEIQQVVEEQATTLLVDSSSNVKRAMLSNIADLCLFFGRQKSSETVLSHIMTYLNDRDWLLRLAFFDGIVGVGAFIGIRAIEEYVLPLMLQALADPEEAVVGRVIASLTSLAALGLLPRMRLWDVFSAVRGFVAHPNAWIRQGTAGFIAAAARNLPPSDVWCILYPSLRPALHSDVLELDEESILSALLPPLSRATLDAAKAAAIQDSPPGFWQTRIPKGSTKTNLVKTTSGNKDGDSSALREKGITPKDEKKIIAMRDFIFKQAHATRARETTDSQRPPEAELTEGKAVSLTDLGVTPQTVFISPRTVGVDKADIRRLRPHLQEGNASRQTSFAGRSVKSVDNPLDELRKRLATMDPPSRAPERSTPEPVVPPSEPSPSESAISSSIDLAVMRKNGRKKLDSKAAPAVASSNTVAVGTTSIHDEPSSGRSTPTVVGSSSGVRGPIAPYSSSYEGQDPGVRAFLEQIDLENYREPLLDFGPRVVASHRKRGPRPKAGSPQGVTMIAHLTQHIGAVTAVVTSPDQLFFATASADSQVLIWDTAKLERSVTAKPRLTYRMDGPVSSMCRIESTHCLAVAAETGGLHVIRVHVSGSGGSVKYGRVECIRAWRPDVKDGHVTYVTHLHESRLLIMTSTSTIALLDMRNMSITTRFQHPLELGVITAVCPSMHWVVVGTESGNLSLWDLRFGLLLKTWRASGGITSCQIHPARGKGRWIMVSIRRKTEESPQVEVWDIEESKLTEVYEVRTTRPSTKGPSTISVESPSEIIMDKSSLIAELAKTRSEMINPDTTLPSSVLTLAVGHSFVSLSLQSREEDGSLLMSVPEAKALAAANPGWMITAGEDRVVRYWDLVKPTEGFVICGSPKEKDVSFKQGSTSIPTLFYTLPISHRQSLNANTSLSQRQPLRPHYDAISALGVVETPFSSCVISADRSGVIKVWRMEGAGAGAGR